MPVTTQAAALAALRAQRTAPDYSAIGNAALAEHLATLAQHKDRLRPPVQA